MVEAVTAFRDSSGKLHDSQLAAARADAKILLEKILGTSRGAEPAITAVLMNAQKIRDAVGAYADMLTMDGLKDEADRVDQVMDEAQAKQLAPETKWECPHINIMDIGAGRKRCLACMTVLGEAKANA